MTTVPCSTNSVAQFPVLFRVINSCYVANDLMARNEWETISKGCVLDMFVGTTDTAGDDFHEDLKGEVRICLE